MKGRRVWGEERAKSLVELRGFVGGLSVVGKRQRLRPGWRSLCEWRKGNLLEHGLLHSIVGLVQVQPLQHRIPSCLFSPSACSSPHYSHC